MNRPTDGCIRVSWDSWQLFVPWPDTISWPGYYQPASETLKNGCVSFLKADLGVIFKTNWEGEFENIPHWGLGPGPWPRPPGPWSGVLFSNSV